MPIITNNAMTNNGYRKQNLDRNCGPDSGKMDSRSSFISSALGAVPLMAVFITSAVDLAEGISDKGSNESHDFPSGRANGCSCLAIRPGRSGSRTTRHLPGYRRHRGRISDSLESIGKVGEISFGCFFDSVFIARKNRGQY
ncbi:unnamed protein product [Protopolystoma xenopodis]|uniref:Uncharacterized protein n=1 Tax=Protopolystoma xenopodis TaxID=117903 RepID=A0A448WPI8_9PLAT|nr:unnamed protein product [Protopolystoma xenopodis]